MMTMPHCAMSVPRLQTSCLAISPSKRKTYKKRTKSQITSYEADQTRYTQTSTRDTPTKAAILRTNHEAIGIFGGAEESEEVVSF